MTCVVCGDEIPADQSESLTFPPALVGRMGCGWCDERLAALAAGTLREKEFRRLFGFAGEHLPPNALRELEVAYQVVPGSSLAAVTEAAILAAEARARSEQLAREVGTMPLTSTGGFTGFRVEREVGFLGTEFLLAAGPYWGLGGTLSGDNGVASQTVQRDLAGARNGALAKLRAQAFEAGANAIIGVAVSYSMVGNTLFGAFASGTAVFVVPTD